jgi:homocysteine S-methyltransferase
MGYYRGTMDRFQQLLDRAGPVVLDGGLATQLESMGCDIYGDLWSATLLFRNPRAIVDAHRAYLDAGAECIISASYQASRSGFMSHGHSESEADRLIASAVELARTARDEYLADNPGVEYQAAIAASVGPYGAVMHDGSEYTGAYDVSDDDLRRFHASRLELLDGCGADALAVETIPNFREAQILCRLLEGVSTPAWVSFACRDTRNISDGSPLRLAAGLFATHPRVLAVGVNCTPPRFISPLIDEVKSAVPGKAIVVYPNSGETYHSGDNSWSGQPCDLDNDFSVDAWHEAGARLIGGCCRTGPEDIARIRTRLEN